MYYQTRFLDTWFVIHKLLLNDCYMYVIIVGILKDPNQIDIWVLSQENLILGFKNTCYLEISIYESSAVLDAHYLRIHSLQPRVDT